jgi:hypothetical protein
MTNTGHDTSPATPTPRFSVWSPLIAGAVDLSTTYFPGWIAASLCAVGVLCALPFRRLRVVAPLAMLVWGAGWLAALILRLTGAGIVGLFLVK